MGRFPHGRVRQLVRQFNENGVKMMLEHSANVRDVFGVLRTPWAERIDFRHLEHVQTTFIRRDYKHLESDIVLTAPLVRPIRSRRKLLIYILIEHQSVPDRLMPLRLADTQLQIFRYQVGEWMQTHKSVARLRLLPVLPVVLYTGVRRWPEVGTLADLIEGGDEFRLMTPIVERPLFLNLPDVSPAELERDGGHFGWVLRLVKERKSRPPEFRALLRRLIAHLETMPPDERARWRDLLSYIGAMIYHVRSEEEHAELQEIVEQSVENQELRQEVVKMGKTIAEALTERGRDEGRIEGRTEGRTEAAIETRQQTLVRLLRKRFGDVPADVVRAVETTTDVEQLDKWLDRFATARTLDELEINGQKPTGSA